MERIKVRPFKLGRSSGSLASTPIQLTGAVAWQVSAKVLFAGVFMQFKEVE